MDFVQGVQEIGHFLVGGIKLLKLFEGHVALLGHA
jgi:hypothetical protein